MKGEWCYFKSQFSKSQCDAIRDAVLLRDAQPATIKTAGEHDIDESVRRSRVWFIKKGDPLLGFVIDRLWKLAIEANDEWFDFHISKLDFAQVAEYDSENLGEYKRHQDVFYINNNPKYHRKLSCVVQLSDPSEYKGGDLCLYGVNESPNAHELRQQGTVIFFPSFVYHAAMPVESGKRFSIAAWFEGPKWR